jgi:hypothetical protein
MLRAMEEILTLHRDDPGGEWVVEVEHATNDKVDYAVYRRGQLIRAVQVKASLPSSSTRLSLHGTKGVATILSHLAQSLQTATEVAFISNRRGPWADIQDWVTKNQPLTGPSLQAVQEDRTLAQTERDVSDLLRHNRVQIGAPSDPASIRALALILEAMLWRLGAQELSFTVGGLRSMSGSEVAEVIGLRDQALANAVGELSWAMRWKEPAGRAVTRPAAFSFLAYELDRRDLSAGRVRRAALTGFGGLGKSMAAAGWAQQNQGLYAMVLWLNSATRDSLEADARQLLAAEHGDAAADYTVEVLQEHFRRWLQATPRNWLLVLDDARSPAVLEGWIPTTGFGHVLITTRDSAWPVTHAPSHEVGRLDAEEIGALVALRLSDVELTPTELEQLARLTDNWALAVDMVLAWMTRTDHNLADLDDFDPAASRQVLLDSPELVPVGYPESVVVIILDALAALQSEAPQAWKLLQSTATLGGQSVPVALASDHHEDTLEDLMRRDQLTAELRARSLAAPMSAGDPRLGQWGYRLSVHDLICHLVTQLEPVDEYRWAELIHHLANAVAAAGERHDLVVVLSLEPVIEAIDEAVLRGQPFTIEYLTLLGNAAAAYAAAGRKAQAARRLQAERMLVRDLATDLPHSVRAAVEWFGLSATVQLAAIMAQLEQPDDALLLLEDAIPRIHESQDAVQAKPLAQLMEHAVDTLQAIRLPILADRRDALLAAAETGPVRASSSPARRAEALLREGDIESAREICEGMLTGQLSPMEKVDLIGKLAETWSVDDVRKSDDLLKLAHIVSMREELDPEQFLTDLQNVIHQRICHILSFGQEALRQGLTRYSAWFDIHGLMPPADHCRTWKQVAMVLLSKAWRELTSATSDAGTSIDAVAAHFARAPQSSQLAEVSALRLALWRTQFTYACKQADHFEAVKAVARKDSTLYIEVSDQMWNQLPELLMRSIVSNTQLVTGHRFGPMVLIRIGTWGLSYDAAQFDPFSRCGDVVTICLARPETLTDAQKPIDCGRTLRLHEIPNPRPDKHYTEYLRQVDALRSSAPSTD